MASGYPAYYGGGRPWEADLDRIQREHDFKEFLGSVPGFTSGMADSLGSIYGPNPEIGMQLAKFLSGQWSQEALQRDQLAQKGNADALSAWLGMEGVKSKDFESFMGSKVAANQASNQIANERLKLGQDKLQANIENESRKRDLEGQNQQIRQAYQNELIKIKGQPAPYDPRKDPATPWLNILSDELKKPRDQKTASEWAYNTAPMIPTSGHPVARDIMQLVSPYSKSDQELQDNIAGALILKALGRDYRNEFNKKMASQQPSGATSTPQPNGPVMPTAPEIASGKKSLPFEQTALGRLIGPPNVQPGQFGSGGQGPEGYWGPQSESTEDPLLKLLQAGLFRRNPNSAAKWQY